MNGIALVPNEKSVWCAGGLIILPICVSSLSQNGRALYNKGAD